MYKRQDKILGINSNFLKIINSLDEKEIQEYENFLILDSDVEILEYHTLDSLIECLSYTKENKKVLLTSPQCAGFYTQQLLPDNFEYYNGHSLSIDKLQSGCCMLLSKEAVEILKKEHSKYPIAEDTKIGYDTYIFNCLKKHGICITVEDEIIYHIDGYFGQRRMYDDYFTNSHTLNIINNEQLFFIKISKEIYPRILNTTVLRKLLRSSYNYESFEENVFNYLEDINNSK